MTIIKFSSQANYVIGENTPVSLDYKLVEKNL
jgi:hypothetical protein